MANGKTAGMVILALIVIIAIVAIVVITTKVSVRFQRTVVIAPLILLQASKRILIVIPTVNRRTIVDQPTRRVGIPLIAPKVRPLHAPTSRTGECTRGRIAPEK